MKNYRMQERSLYLGGDQINSRACQVLIEIKAEIPIAAKTIDEMEAQLNALKAENAARQQLVDELLACGFCEIDKERSDPLTGQKWIGHQTGCRNNRKGGKHGLV